MDDARARMSAEVKVLQRSEPRMRRVTRFGILRALLGGAVITLSQAARGRGLVSAKERKARKRRKAAKRRARGQAAQPTAVTQPVCEPPAAATPRPDPIIIEDPCEAFFEDCNGTDAA